MLKRMSVALFVVSAFAAHATVWWVAKEDPNASDSNAGTDETAPLRTIQAALDKPDFAAGDTVKVKRGFYDEGTTVTDASYVSNRVTVTKAAHIIGVDGADVTFIMGAPSPGSTDTYGRGPYATRCVFVAAGAESTIIEKLTLCGGRTTGLGSSDSSGRDVGGGFYAAGNSKVPVLVDCVISNCVSWKGAGMRGGTAVRCYIAENHGTSSGVAMNGAYAYCCIIAYNSGYNTFSSSTLCNCTVYKNTGGAVATGGGNLYSSIFVDNQAPDPGRYTGSNTPGSVFTATNGMGVVKVDRWQIVGPAVGDWRVVAGSDAETSGIASHARASAFANIPAAERYKDFYGNPIPDTGTIIAGAVQVSAPVVAGGIALSSASGTVVTGMAVDGHPARAGDFVLATAWPTQFTVTATAGTVNRYIRRIGTGYDYVAPRMDDSALVMPLPGIGTLVSNDVQYATAEYWVDPVNGDDENPGTEAAPFRTLQQSYDAILAARDDYPVVHAVAGDYREGGAPLSRYNSNDDYALTNRLCIASSNVRYKGAGAGQSFIWGEPDGSVANGLGDAAIGCIFIYSGYAIIQGFTLTNGYTRNFTDSRGNGDVVFGRAQNDYMPILADSTISGCSARDALTYNVRLHRCRVLDNAIVKGVLANGGAFISCVFAGNTLSDTSRSALTGDNLCVGSTVVGKSQAFVPFGNYIHIYGCVVDNGVQIRATSNPAVSMADNLSIWNHFPTVISAAAGFNDPANGDFRVKSYSGALRCTPLPTAADSWAANFCRFAIGDVDGRRLISPDGEHVLAGAVQEVVPAANTVYFRTPNGGVGDGTVAYAAGELVATETLSLTRAPGTRPCVGFVVDGETNLFDEVTLPVTVAPSANGHAVIALYTKDWYVNCDRDVGDDAALGFTPKTAKWTLAAALSAPGLVSGDTVHAAPGTYDEGVMTYSETQQLRSRAIVPEGVTLVGDAGPERTIILGAAATVDADANGLGTNAIRCVTLNDAEVRGFTLTGGHTACIGGHGTDAEQTAAKSNAENIGGGVGFAKGSTANHVVTDCIISNNVAWRGGAAYYASLRRCRVIGNLGCDNSGRASGTYRCEHYGCLIANQRSNYGAMYPAGLYDSTIIHTNYNTAFYVTTQTCPVRNSIIIGTTHNEATKNVAYNTFLTAVSDKTSEAFIGEGSALVTLDQLQLDADGRPVVGANVAIDAGSTNRYDALSGTTDLSGGQRIYNGRLDAGALEADWRPRYAVDMGDADGMAVTEASPDVVEDESGRVCISNGTVAVSWANGVAPKLTTMTYGFEVTGTGTLTVTAGGETATFTAADGAQSRSLRTRDAMTDLTFAYVPGAADTGGAILSGFDRASGGVIILR